MQVKSAVRSPGTFTIASSASWNSTLAPIAVPILPVLDAVATPLVLTVAEPSLAAVVTKQRSSPIPNPNVVAIFEPFSTAFDVALPEVTSAVSLEIELGEHLQYLNSADPASSIVAVGPGVAVGGLGAGGITVAESTRSCGGVGTSCVVLTIDLGEISAVGQAPSNGGHVVITISTRPATTAGATGDYGVPLTARLTFDAKQLPDVVAPLATLNLGNLVVPGLRMRTPFCGTPERPCTVVAPLVDAGDKVECVMQIYVQPVQTFRHL